MYRLSPSDFAYLYEECTLCYYLKVTMGIQRPMLPFPGVFTALNTRLQGALIGNDLRKLSSVLPEGTVESQEGFIESQPIPHTKVYIKGKYDLLVRQRDGTYLIVDFKISRPSEEKTAKYQRQLQAYHYAFEHPARGEAKNVTKLGLIVMYPDQVKFTGGQASISFPPQWMEIDSKKDSFLKFMGEVNRLLEGPPPPANSTCQWCKYRNLGEKLTRPNQPELPLEEYREDYAG